MAQIFPRFSNPLSKFSIIAAVSALGLVGALLWLFYRSPYFTETRVVREQPVPFSHKHHAGGVGIDCRYCHTSVEKSAFAGIPAVATCMNCHSQVWKNSPMLAPVREAYKTGRPIAWTRVHQLPDYVYFNHSIHVSKGIGCSTCHGPVQKMPLMRAQNRLYMQWCLQCHRAPEKFVRPKEEVFNMNWKVSAQEQAALGPKLVKEYQLKKMTSCSVCHR